MGPAGLRGVAAAPDGPLGRLARGPGGLPPPGGADGGRAPPADRPFADGRDGRGGFPDGRGGRLELLIGSTRGCSFSVDSVSIGCTTEKK